jgi:haloalkane dehalogenase
MDILRTPDQRFAQLEDWPYAPRYCEVRDAEDGTVIRIHHIDEGPRDADPILLMHGNPTWVYLYRKMIPVLLAAGHRVIAVDLVGNGRSDKPALKSDYTLARHYQWMNDWLHAMDLRHITLFCQDWGGTIGLAMVSEQPERFDRVVASNTGVPEGQGESEFMKMWVNLMRNATTFPLRQMLPQGMVCKLTAAELDAYVAPFPDDAYMAGIIAFPLLIAVQPDNPGVPLNARVWEGLERFDKPFLTLWGKLDPVSRGVDREMQRRIPGTHGQPHQRFEQANHFIQEDVPEALAEHTLRFIAATPR